MVLPSLRAMVSRAAEAKGRNMQNSRHFKCLSAMPAQNSWAFGPSVGGNYSCSAFLNSKLKVPQPEDLKTMDFLCFHHRGAGGFLESRGESDHCVGFRSAWFLSNCWETGFYTGSRIPKDYMELGSAVRAQKAKPSPIGWNTLFKDLRFSRKKRLGIHK